MSHTCRRCNPELVFDSSHAKRQHMRANHQQSCKITHADGTQGIIHASANGKWICSHPACCFEFSRPDSLQRHYASIHASERLDSTREESMQEEEQEHSQEGPSSSSEFTHHEQEPIAQGFTEGVVEDPMPVEVRWETPQILRKARMSIVKYDESMTLLYCHSCDTMVDGSTERSVVEHIRGHVSLQGHRRRETPRDRDPHHGQYPWDSESLDRLKQAIRGIGFTPLQNLRHHLRQGPGESRVLPRIPLLSVQIGWSCSLCDYHGVKKKVMKNHGHQHHRRDPGFAILPSSVQMATQGAPRRYFAVNCASDQAQHPATNDATRSARRSALLKDIADINKTLHNDRNPPARQLPPWLVDSKWIYYAAQLIPEDVRFEDLKGAMEVSRNDSGPYSRVKDVLRGYASALRNRVLSAAEFNVRRAVAQDTEKGFTGFMVTETIDQYLPVMTGFLVALLRSACDDPGSGTINIVVATADLKEHLEGFRLQLQSLSGIPIEDDFDYQVVQKVLLAIWAPPRDSKFRAAKSADCLLVQFLILYSLKPCSRGDSYAWKHVSEVAKMFSMLMFWCRSTIQMEICRRLWVPGAEDMDAEDAQKLLVYTDANCATLQGTPFSYLCSMQKLISTVAMEETIRPQVVSDDLTFKECEMGGRLITLAGFRDLIHALIKESVTIMEDEVLRGLNTDWIQQLLQHRGEPIVDALNKREVGYSFISDEDNVFVRHEQDLHVHMLEDSSSPFVSAHNADGTIAEYNQTKLGLWMKSCSRLEELLGMLLHFTSGQPPRAKEYESFLIRNTTSNERSFFWSQETLVIFQVYNKTDSKPRRKMKLVVRFLPKCLRKLFIQYLSLVRPVETFVAAKLWSTKAGALYRDVWFVRMGSVGCTRKLSEAMEREFSKHCNAPISMRKYRHLAKYFCEPIRATSEALQNEPLDASAGHSIAIAGHCYAQNLYDHRHVGRDRWRQFKHVAEKWHKLLQLPEELPTEFTRHTSPPRPPGTIRYHLPRGHYDTHPRQPFTGSPDPNPPASGPCQTEVECWPPRKRRRLLFHACDSREPKVGSNNTLEHIETHSMHQATAALAHFGYSDWKIPEQAIAVAMALDNIRDFVAILPTGSGKSFVFMAAAVMSRKTTVVVVPLFMLIKGHLAECRSAKITGEEFTSATSATRPPRIVFVSAEVAITEHFRLWINDLNAVGKLHSIVIDEVHLVLASYRHKMGQLIKLSFLKCQMIGLTASLPPRKEMAIERTLGRLFTVIRAKTIRLNLRYGVIQAADIDMRILERLQEWLSNSPAPEDRAMVYCMTRFDAEKFHDYLRHQGVESSFIHAHVQPQEEKVARVRAWEEGHTKILVATSVIGCGYNYPCVRLVLHRGTFYTMEGYHQESGRCGRDGKEGVCQVVSNPAYRRWAEESCGEQSGPNVLQDLKKANEWIENKSLCRRFNIHDEMDGEPAVCILLPGAMKCDLCVKAGSIFHYREENNAPSHGSMYPPEDVPLESVQPTEAFVVRPEDVLRERNHEKDVKDYKFVRARVPDGERCLVCHKRHPLNKPCPQLRPLCFRCLSRDHRVCLCPVKEAMQQGNQHQRYQGCCHKCYFPMDPVGDVHPHRWSDQFGVCSDESGERIRILIWHLYRNEDARTELRRKFESMPSNDIELEPWLVKTEPDHVFNNFVRVAAAAIEIRQLRS